MQMRKNNWIVLLLLISLLLCGCSSARYATPAQAEEVFQTMQDALEEAFHTPATDCTVSYAPVCTTRFLIIPVSDTEELHVQFFLHGAQYSDEKGVIHFTVTDHVQSGTDMKDHDFSSFLKAIRIVSAKELDEETLMSFVSAKEEEYPASAYGLHGTEDTLSYKMRSLDFWETWILSQEKTSTYEEVSYSGEMKIMNDNGQG